MDNKDFSLWWEFFPKKQTDHDPIPITVNLEGDDTVAILYDHEE